MVATLVILCRARHTGSSVGWEGIGSSKKVVHVVRRELWFMSGHCTSREWVHSARATRLVLPFFSLSLSHSLSLSSSHLVACVGDSIGRERRYMQL